MLEKLRLTAEGQEKIRREVFSREGFDGERGYVRIYPEDYIKAGVDAQFSAIQTYLDSLTEGEVEKQILGVLADCVVLDPYGKTDKEAKKLTAKIIALIRPLILKEVDKARKEALRIAENCLNTSPPHLVVNIKQVRQILRTALKKGE